MGRFLSRTVQVFEVLHYVGSCLLKIIKLRLFGGGEKEPQYSSECDVATSPSDRDPFILQAENKVFIDNNMVQGEGILGCLNISNTIKFSRNRSGFFCRIIR